MHRKIHPVGRGAASKKYDLLTAMGAYALSKEKGDQRRVLRFITLVTARYNWVRDELAIGTREIARLWSCDERTVKREMARLRASHWLYIKRQGVRGRVSEYGMNIDQILEDTRQNWSSVGPDFSLRMDVTPTPDVVPLPPRGDVPAPDVTDGSEWALARAVMHAEDAALYAAWIMHLTRVERAGGRLVLSAPTRFHAAYVETHLRTRILAACQSIDGDVTDVSFVI